MQGIAFKAWNLQNYEDESQSSPLPKHDRKSTHHIFHPKSEVLTQSRQNPIERSANLRASLRLASFIYGKALPPEKISPYTVVHAMWLGGCRKLRASGNVELLVGSQLKII